MGLDEFSNQIIRRMDSNPMSSVLQINNLQVTYYTDAGGARALDGVSLSLKPGEKLGLVGESRRG